MIKIVRCKNKSFVTEIITKSGLVKVWSPKETIDEKVQRSMKNLTKYPDVFPYVAIMPDFHVGEMSVNGSIIPSRNTLYVNAIGGDIGCGIASLRLPLFFF